MYVNMHACMHIIYVCMHGGGRSVGIVRLRTKGHGVCFLFCMYAYINVYTCVYICVGKCIYVGIVTCLTEGRRY
jgi:hypothetical protein